MSERAEATVTIGTFDGFHRGHAAVVAVAREHARAAGTRLGIYTFDPHPKAVVSPRGAPPALCLESDRRRLLYEAGADDVHVLHFDRALAALSAEEFLEHHVLSRYRLDALVVGYDFAMGRGREGSVPRLREIGAVLGFIVDQVAELEAGGAPISSSRIRSAIRDGDVESAAAWLGRPFRLTGTVVRGAGRGAGLGFPTANLDVPEILLRPARGVYAGWVGGLERPWPAVANLGRRPTFGGGEETVEAHLLGFSGDLVERSLTLDLVHRLRPERRFNGPEALADQIAVDCREARRLLAVPDPEPDPEPGA